MDNLEPSVDPSVDIHTDLKAEPRQIKRFEKFQKLLATLSPKSTLAYTGQDSSQSVNDARFQAVFAYAIDGMVICDSESMVIDANPTAIAIFGLDKNNLLRYSLKEFYYSEAGKTFDKDWQLFLKNGFMVGVFTLKRSDGAIKELEYMAKANISPGQHLLVLRDTTERLLAQSIVEKSEQQYRTLFETMVQGVVYENSSKQIVSVNPAAEIILGMPLTQLKQKSLSDFPWQILTDDTDHGDITAFPSYISFETGKEVTNVIVGLASGTEKKMRWLMTHAVPQFKEGEPKPHKVFTTFEDITQRKEAEDQLVDRSRQLELANKNIAEEKVKDEAILGSIGDGMIATDADRMIVMMNSAAEDLLGWKKEELIGKSISEFMHVLDEKGNEIPEKERPIHSAITGKKVTRKYYYMRKDGSRFFASITATPVILNNEIVGTIEILRDITKEKEIDRMKTEFISLASHQLRTPLSAIKWFTEMLINGDAGQLTKEQAEFTRNILESNERMIGLVNAILNISRIESGRIIIDPKPTDLKDLIHKLLTELQPKIIEKQHKLSFTADKMLPTINIDPKLIREVYMNLLTNAVKYTPHGGEITITITKRENDVLSEIADNGYGIAEHQQEKVFQKFFRAENIVKLETDGTGLGLYLAKAIIDSSNGSIWFTSEEGKGTKFSFTIPLTGTLAKEGEVSLNT